MPNPQSTIRNPQFLPPLPDKQDRDRLTLLYRTNGDTVSFIDLAGEDNPLDLLVWLNQPHIKPWHEAISAAYRDNRQAATQTKLARCLSDVTRILDLEADSTLRIRAVNAVIRLANAIHRGTRLTPVSPRERHYAQERAEDSTCALDLNLERRAARDTDLEDAKAPVGTTPSWARNPLPAEGRSLGIRRGGAGEGWARIPSAPEIAPSPHPSPDSHTSHPHLNGQALNGHHKIQSSPPGRDQKSSPTAARLNGAPHHLNGSLPIRNPQSPIRNLKPRRKPRRP
jgi:hypothetical protein